MEMKQGFEQSGAMHQQRRGNFSYIKIWRCFGSVMDGYRWKLLTWGLYENRQYKYGISNY
jgi:hypothetical protein